MGFLKGNATFQRFKVAGSKPKLFDDVHLERLRDHRAGRQRVASADGIEAGWTGGRHILDLDFDQEKNVFTDHLLFDLRIETNKFPSDRLKAYYETDLKALIKDNPSGRPSARQKREAKESARNRLEQEAKDGRFRKWKCIPIAWDAVTNTAFYGAAGLTHVGRFSMLWDESFGANFTQEAIGGKLESINAATLALALYPQAKDEGLSPFVPGTTPEDSPTWCPQEGVPNWLGNEFLLWLWYFSDCEGDAIKTPDGNEVTFMFCGGIKVQDPRGVSGDCTANSESAVRLPEAKAAVRAGKLPRKAALAVVRNTDQFRFVLQAETLAVTGAKLPAVQDAANERERQLAHLQHLRDLAEIIDQLYGAFLARRMSSYWSQDVKEIAGWLKSGGKVRA